MFLNTFSQRYIYWTRYQKQKATSSGSTKLAEATKARVHLPCSVPNQSRGAATAAPAAPPISNGFSVFIRTVGGLVTFDRQRPPRPTSEVCADRCLCACTSYQLTHSSACSKLCDGSRRYKESLQSARSVFSLLFFSSEIARVTLRRDFFVWVTLRMSTVIIFWFASA